MRHVRMSVFDVFSLCLKSGNASILKGGSDADASNRAIVQLIHEVLEEFWYRFARRGIVAFYSRGDRSASACRRLGGF